MTEALINHLWQSTLFAFAAAMSTLAFHRNGANTRFHIWLAASVKFLIPFPLCVYVGKHLRWETTPTVHTTPELSLVIDQIAQPGAMITNSFAAATAKRSHALGRLGGRFSDMVDRIRSIDLLLVAPVDKIARRRKGIVATQY
jgi:hypothetical protein